MADHRSPARQRKRRPASIMIWLVYDEEEGEWIACPSQKAAEETASRHEIAQGSIDAVVTPYPPDRSQVCNLINRQQYALQRDTVATIEKGKVIWQK